jgi:hypothetical protein
MGDDHLAISAALSAAAVTIIVCGAPFFLDADHSLVELPANLSKKPERLSRVLGLFQDVVSVMAFAEIIVR